MSSAGRPQSVRRVRHRQNGYYRTDDRGVAVAADDVNVPRRRDLCAGNFTMAAAHAGHVELMRVHLGVQSLS